LSFFKSPLASRASIRSLLNLIVGEGLNYEQGFEEIENRWRESHKTVAGSYFAVPILQGECVMKDERSGVLKGTRRNGFPANKRSLSLFAYKMTLPQIKILVAAALFGLLVYVPVSLHAMEITSGEPEQTKLTSGVELPPWVFTPDYGGYIGAVGSVRLKGSLDYNSARRTAFKIAQAELARQITVITSSELTMEQTRRLSAFTEEYLSSIRFSARQSASELIENAVIEDEWLDKSTNELYLWAVIRVDGGRGAKGPRFISGNVVRDVAAEGACAVSNMTAEQSRLIALNRARAAAIEKAAGVEVKASTLITNFELSLDLIKTYSKGIVIKERVEWLPLGQYQADSSDAPVPVFRVKVTADIYLPKKRSIPTGLEAGINNSVFRAGEKVEITLRTVRKARIAIFNFSADDMVTMLFPNRYDGDNILQESGEMTYPPAGSPVKLKVQTLQGHKRDGEALFIVAMDDGQERDLARLFTPFKPMTSSDFFNKYSEIADYCDDVILTYEVVAASR